MVDITGLNKAKAKGLTDFDLLYIKAMNTKMKKKGKKLEFISLIKRDGSGVVPIPTPWNSKSGHAKTDNMSYLDDEKLILTTLSLREGTYIASGFNSYVVRLKNKNPKQILSTNGLKSSLKCEVVVLAQ